MDPQNARQGGDQPQPSSPQDNRSAAANVLRTQINSLYNNQPTGAYKQDDSIGDGDNPYNRVHTDHPQPQADQWKAYHTAWQNYYQKYYEAYYAYQSKQQETRHKQELQQKLSQQLNATVTGAATNTAADASQDITAPTAANNTPISSQSAFFTHTASEPATTEEEITKETALAELRSKLRNTVQERATKVRKSKHFIPIIAALSVILIFLFLQYNSILIGAVYAYVAPGAIDPQNIVVDPTATTEVGDESRLIIPKINVDVPVLYDVGSDYDSQMAAMQKGVAHFAIPGANSHPGEVGNTVLSGHSSNDLFDPGDYKFIFAQLDKLEKGDTIYANYKGTRYTYVVTKKEVVKPTEVSKLVYTTTTPVMTLITCTPLGTSLNRLLVTAEQISPDPAEATVAPASSSDDSSTSTSIPGSSPTVLERLFGASGD